MLEQETEQQKRVQFFHASFATKCSIKKKIYISLLWLGVIKFIKHQYFYLLLEIHPSCLFWIAKKI